MSLVLLSRLVGFFCLSPFFSNKSIPQYIRFALALTCTALIAPPLLKKIPNPIEIQIDARLLILMITEVLFGYLLGLLFSILFEAAAFAGEILGVMMGLSATELLDPFSNTRHPLLSRFFLLFATALFLTLDLHHPLFRFVFESFQLCPLQLGACNPNYLELATTILSYFFHFALEFALLPLFALLSLTALFALLSRFFSIFWIGFPLQLLVGFGLLTSMLYFFTPLLQKFFQHLLVYVKNSIVNY